MRQTFQTSALTLLLALVVTGCQNRAVDPADVTAVYGTYSSEAIPIPATRVAKNGDSFVGERIAIKGRVVEVCERRGCWFALDTSSPSVIRVKVPRKENGEYEYTVPKSINGKTIVADGVLFSTMLSEDQQQHFADDQGKDAEAGMASAEFQMVATGIQVL